MKTKAADVYLQLRDSVLTAKPDSLMTDASSLPKVWAVVMEIGGLKGTATLVAIADGTVSIYFSGGGGIIGLGPHEGPKKASQALLAFAPLFLPLCGETSSCPLPLPGHTRFYLRTFERTLTREARTEDLDYNRDALSPLFRKADTLLTEVRLVDEKLRAKESRSDV
jgi:hypothetical protein